MKRCSIVRAADSPPLSDAVNGALWARASLVRLDEFPVGEDGPGAVDDRPSTV